MNLADEGGRPLDGANKYSIHFDKGAALRKPQDGQTAEMERVAAKMAMRYGSTSIRDTVRPAGTVGR
jgi:hypothetical protein